MTLATKTVATLCGLTLAISAAFAQDTADPVLQRADTLLKAGKPAEAYLLLEPLEFTRSGDVRFDYLLGISALDSDKADKATLAFERVLAVDPDFAGARLDMARAYYQMGDLSRAKTEFEAVLKQNPPEAARVTIQKYLSAIAAYAQAKETQVTGYVEGLVGYDSNIASTSTQSFTFPTGPSILSGLTVSPAANLSGNYGGINAGIDVNHRVNDKWAVFGGAGLRHHANSSQTAYDSTAIDLQGGVAYTQDKHTLRLSVSAGQTNSGQTAQRNATGLGATWQYNLGPADQLNAFAQWGKNRSTGYPATSPATDVRIEGDTDQTVVGLGWLHLLNDGRQALFGNAYSGFEMDVAPVAAGNPTGGRPDGRKDFYGLRFGGQTKLNETSDAFASVGWQSAQYGKANAVFGMTRNETQVDLSLGMAWRFAPQWTLKPQIAWSSKTANISLYSSVRTDVSLTVRRDFN